MNSVGVKVKSMMGHKMNECQLDGKVQENAFSKYSLLYNKKKLIKYNGSILCLLDRASS